MIAWAPRWEKKEKKIDERSEPRGILAGRDRSPIYIFFLFDPVFCLFGPTAEPGPRLYGYD